MPQKGRNETAPAPAPIRGTKKIAIVLVSLNRLFLNYGPIKNFFTNIIVKTVGQKPSIFGQHLQNHQYPDQLRNYQLSIQLKLLQIVSGYIIHARESTGIIGVPNMVEDSDCIMHQAR